MLTLLLETVAAASTAANDINLYAFFQLFISLFVTIFLPRFSPTLCEVLIRVVGGIAMTCVINLANRRPVQKSPKQLPHHAGIILLFERKAECAPHFSKGVQRKLFRRIRPNVAELLADPVPETLLLELSDLS